MLSTKTVRALAVSALLVFCPLFRALTQAQNGAAGNPGFADSVPPGGTIPAGTRITVNNWQKYKQFMPDGMVALFQRRYYWKMPSDVEMEVGPTVIHPLPKTYLAATEKYASQVTLLDLPDGRLSLSGYQGGTPFPNPAGPNKGWKILANLWYRYMPHLLVDTYGTACYADRFGSISCNADEIVYRQLSFNTDPGIPVNIPGAEGKFYSEWVMTVAPEQQKYHASLTMLYSNLSKPEDLYVFNPTLRIAGRQNQSWRNRSQQEAYALGRRGGDCLVGVTPRFHRLRAGGSGPGTQRPQPIAVRPPARRL